MPGFSLNALRRQLASQFRMIRTLWMGLVLVAAWPAALLAQFGSFSEIPIEFTADETRAEGGVAVAEGNVQIHRADVSIYTDYAEYDAETRDILLIGNIRIYTPDNLFTGQRVLYNLESKQIRALEFAGENYPLKFRALSIRAPSLREFRVQDATFTTDDSSQPDFRVKAKTVRVYPDNRVVFVNSTVYIGQIPVFWFPYLFAYTDNTGFEFRPGYDSDWGYYLLTAYSFPLGTGGNAISTVHADYRQELGFGAGFDTKFQFGKDDRSYGLFRSYYAYDDNPDYRLAPGERAESDDNNRYRISFQNRLFLTDDIYATFDINKLSDYDFLEDYFPNEFRLDPQPDNMVALTKWDEFYTLTLWTRWQMNDFFETTERLPELALDIKQHQLFGLPIYYDGENTLGYYRRAFPDGSQNPDYSTTRFDTFHQISYPRQYFGWLSITPRVGVRGTFYEKTGKTIEVLSEDQQRRINNLTARAQQSRLDAERIGQSIAQVQQALSDPDLRPSRRAALERQLATLEATQEQQLANAQTLDSQANAIETGDLQGRQLETGGATFRPVVNAGIEASFKLSKKYEWIQSRMLGIDGVLHTIQPYVNYSYVHNAGLSPGEILQFDRVVPATEPLPIDFPQFVAIDSIDTWSIMRTGVRNRITTRRGDNNFEWFVIDSFFDWNFDNPYQEISGTGDVSNVVNRLSFQPLPWVGVAIDAQLPMTDEGYTDVNTGLTFMPFSSWIIQFSNRYIDQNPFFEDSNRLGVYSYYRINPNWAVSVQGQYEAVQDILLLQRYMVHRDLSAWTVSVGAEVRQNQNSETEYGVLFSMTLKDAPQVTLPLAFDQGTTPLGNSGE
jgi:LPS-assembly protein